MKFLLLVIIIVLLVVILGVLIYKNACDCAVPVAQAQQQTQELMSPVSRCLYTCDLQHEQCYRGCVPHDDICVRNCYQNKTDCYMTCLNYREQAQDCKCETV